MLPPANSTGGNTNTNSGKRGLRPAWVKGQSGNPNGRPKIEPRVRRYARKYDQRMCKVLAEIAEDPKAPWSERRRAAMDLIAVGSGRPPTTQELVGRPDAPLGPLVNINMGSPSGAGITPQQARQIIREGRAPREQLASAEAVLVDHAAHMALPAPAKAASPPIDTRAPEAGSTAIAIQAPTCEATERAANPPGNVVELPKRSQTPEGSAK